VEKRTVDIDRILDAIGRDIVPVDLNRHALKRSLDFSVRQYWAVVERNSDQPRRDLIKYYREVEKAVRKLQNKLRNRPRVPYPWEWVELTSGTEVLESMVKRCNTVVEELQSEIEFGLDWEEELELLAPFKATTEYYKQRSPIDWLAGYYLPRVYWNHFGHPPVTTRGGPYERFAGQVCEEYKIYNKGTAYQSDTFVKALTDELNGRSRRKGKA
jgi:hypothetical protein